MSGDGVRVATAFIELNVDDSSVTDTVKGALDNAPAPTPKTPAARWAKTSPPAQNPRCRTYRALSRTRVSAAPRSLGDNIRDGRHQGSQRRGKGPHSKSGRGGPAFIGERQEETDRRHRQ